MASRQWSIFRSLLILSFVSLGACGDSGPSGPDPDDAIASVTISPPQATVDVGSTTQLNATVLNGRGESMSTAVTWSSSAPTVGTVDNSGTVTGVAEGSTTVTASAGGRSGTAAVTVNDPFPPAQPTNVVAAPVSNTAIQVTWTDNAGNEDEFRVDREEAAGGVSGTDNGPSRVFAQVGSVGPNVTTFQDTGLEPGTAYNYRVRACNENGCSDPVADPNAVTTYTLLVIETSTLPRGWVGEAYQQTLSTTGGGGAVAWSVSSGSLPDGITLSETGILSGTPTTGGAVEFAVQAVGGGQTVTQTLSLFIYPQLVITTSSVPNGVLGFAYSAHLQASGGDNIYMWAVSAGTLPPGLMLDVSGLLVGTPHALGSYHFTAEVSSGGRTDTADFVINVHTPLIITTLALPQGATGSAYSTTLEGTGGAVPYTWSLSAGSLPAGLSLAPATGIVSGTPTAAGLFPLTVQLQSADGQTVTSDLSLNVSFVFSCSTQSEIPQAECEALEVLYNTTNGPGWTTSTNWLADFSPCGWFGVSCVEGSVTRLHLRGIGLTGPIPPQLRNLANLQELLLDSNELTGAIPPELGDMTSLVYLYMEGNELSGPVPSELGNLTNLLSLHLNHNLLTGSIPPELGDLPNLVRLDLDQNQLTGNIPPELGKLPAIERISASFNQLTGSIPPEFGDLPSLKFLGLNSNQLTGPIPFDLGDLPSITNLYLHYNQLTGPIPPELGSLSTLSWLLLHKNQLSGTIPPELADLPNLIQLSIQNNQLTGTIPPELGELSNLELLDLRSNQLTGAIPPELGSLANLRFLFLNSNQLGSTVPLEVALLGGQLQNTQGLNRCMFIPGNTGLALLDTQAYRDADLDSDGFICGLGFPPSPLLSSQDADPFPFLFPFLRGKPLIKEVGPQEGAQEEDGGHNHGPYEPPDGRARR